MTKINNNLLHKSENFTNRLQKKDKGFVDLLKEKVEDVNQDFKIAENLSKDLASGKSGNIHETMLSLSKAEVNFYMMVQVRNRAIEAYQEIMRMQI